MTVSLPECRDMWSFISRFSCWVFVDALPEQVLAVVAETEFDYPKLAL